MLMVVDWLGFAWSLVLSFQVWIVGSINKWAKLGHASALQFLANTFPFKVLFKEIQKKENPRIEPVPCSFFRTHSRKTIRRRFFFVLSASKFYLKRLFNEVKWLFGFCGGP